MTPADIETGLRAARILWLGDAVVPTGFARCTHSVCDHLHAIGWDVTVLGVNYHGDPHGYPYAILPCLNPTDYGHDLFGVSRLPHIMGRVRPDLVVILTDPWHVPKYLDEIQYQAGADETLKGIDEIPVAAWLAVDGENHPSKALNRLDLVATWTEFAAGQLKAGGYKGPSAIVPLGIDVDHFVRRDIAQSRRVSCPEAIPPDAFIVGRIDRNQHRKRWDLTVRYFAHWLEAHPHPDAYLYCHTAPTGEKGINIISLAHHYGVSGRVILAQQEVGFGVPEAVLPSVYSSFDVYLTTTQGEGWGLPVHEAMSCGVPCIVPEWAALAEWTRGAAIQVACSSVAPHAPLDTSAYVIGGVMDEAGAVEALEMLYRSADERKTYSELGRGRAELYPESAVGPRFADALRSHFEIVQPDLPAEVAV